MNKLFVPYELALKLKEKGFDENCLAYYNSVVAEGSKPLLKPIDTDFINFIRLSEPLIKAPLYQQVIDWFDDIHKIRIDLIHSDPTGKYKYTIWKWNFDNNIGKWNRISCLGLYSDKIERNNQAIEEALKLI